MSASAHENRNGQEPARIAARFAGRGRHIAFDRGWAEAKTDLTEPAVAAHLEGRATVGAFTGTAEWAEFGVIDVDLHVRDAAGGDRDPTPAEVSANTAYALKKSEELDRLGVRHLLLRHNRRGSFHLFVPAERIGSARLGRWLAARVRDAGSAGVTAETFPFPTGTPKGCRLPGRHHKHPDEWTELYADGSWVAYPAALYALADLEPNPADKFTDPGEPELEAPKAGPGPRVTEPDHGALPGERPGEHYDRVTDVNTLLRVLGFTLHSDRDGRARYTRPGKKPSDGLSASVLGNSVWVFTSGVPGLRPSAENGGKPYTPFGLYIALSHGGDAAAAAAELARLGYGCKGPGQHVTVDWGAAAAGGRGRSSEPSCVVPPPRARYVPAAPYVPFPTDVLPGPWAEFVRQGAAALRCDEAFVALPVLSALAAAVGNTRRAYLGGEWFEPAVLWTCVVAESGSLKSPAADLVVDLVKARQKTLVKVFRDQMDEYKRKVAESRSKKRGDDAGEVDEPDKPTLKRVLVSDVTIEKLAGILDDNRRGLLVYRDEAAGWLGSFTRYKGQGGGSDEPNWLSMHRADAITYDRKSGDKTTIYVPHAAVSVAGGIQPGTLARLMTQNLLESGLAARIIFAMPPRRPKTYVEAGIDEAVRAAARKSIDDLFGLSAEVDDDGDPRPVLVRLTTEARQRFRAFVNEWGLRQFQADRERASALAKLEALPGRFALIHHVATHAADMEDTDPIGLESVEAGIRLAGWAASETDRVYAMLGESAGEKDLRVLVELVSRLAARGGGRLTVKLLQKSNNRKYRTREAAEFDLDRLVSLGLGRWEDAPQPQRGGKRMRFFVPCTTHDDSDDRDEDEGEDGAGGTSDDRPEAPTGADDVTGQKAGSCGAVVESTGGRSSESSCVVQESGPECGPSDATPPVVVRPRVGDDPVVVQDRVPPRATSPDPSLPTTWIGTRPNGRPDPGGELPPGRPLPPHATHWKQPGSDWTPVQGEGAQP
jgi:hypothetical protein